MPVVKAVQGDCETALPSVQAYPWAAMLRGVGAAPGSVAALAWSPAVSRANRTRRLLVGAERYRLSPGRLQSGLAGGTARLLPPACHHPERWWQQNFRNPFYGWNKSLCSHIMQINNPFAWCTRLKHYFRYMWKKHWRCQACTRYNATYFCFAGMMISKILCGTCAVGVD